MTKISRVTLYEALVNTDKTGLSLPRDRKLTAHLSRYIPRIPADGNSLFAPMAPLSALVLGASTALPIPLPPEYIAW